MKVRFVTSYMWWPAGTEEDLDRALAGILVAEGVAVEVPTRETAEEVRNIRDGILRCSWERAT